MLRTAIESRENLKMKYFSSTGAKLFLYLCSECVGCSTLPVTSTSSLSKSWKPLSERFHEVSNMERIQNKRGCVPRRNFSVWKWFLRLKPAERTVEVLLDAPWTCRIKHCGAIEAQIIMWLMSGWTQSRRGWPLRNSERFDVAARWRFWLCYDVT
jgi:hypothetical protein